ncbi:hypothetical protein FS749_007172 [Ceratobasidium sp. UAMH 11750]|nr:hypothetical protein FS749_007172 [Ceratobasidium sp. UAMH 11750]
MEHLTNFGEAPSVDRYKSSLERPTRPLPSIQQIKTTISSLHNAPRSVTLDTLEDIMMLRYLPEHFDVPTGPMIPSCIAILEQSAKHGKVLDNRAGVLALQLLCFSISLAILIRNNCHDRFIESLRREREAGYLPPFRCDLSLHLVAHVSIMMEDIIKRGKQELSHGLAAPHGLFGWTKNNGLVVCFEELGGFSKHHARFLLRHLWAQRDSIMKPFQEVFLPGFTFIIHAVWKHAAFLDEPGALTMMDQLRELVIRYSSVSTSFEDLILHRHYLELHGTVDDPPKAGPVNRDDLVTVVANCVLKLNPPEGCPSAAPKLIPLDFAADLIDALSYDIHKTKAFELCLPLLKAGFIRFWVDMSKVPEDNTIRWIDIVPFTYRLLQMSQINLMLSRDPMFRRRVTTYPVLSVILEGDLVNLLGRLCLMPMLLDTIPPGVENG